ncbi:MAG: hypothetical protein R6X22_05445 [Gemmatimonadota bacterium]
MLAEQEPLDEQCTQFERWLAAPSSMPADSFDATPDAVAFSNRTMFPRRTARATMVASGQLRFLRDLSLLTCLPNFQANVNPRLGRDGELYDANQTAVMGGIAPMASDAFDPASSDR